MRYKLHLKIEIKKIKKFLFNERYCGRCGLVFWLENVPILDGNEVCPICNETLFFSKRYARIEYAKRIWK